MPNWIKGDLRMRGKQKDLLIFLNDGLDGDYIKGTHRGFVTDIDVADFEKCGLKSNSDEVETIAIPVKFAWDINADQLQQIALNYNIDIRIYGYECGMEFNRYIEVIDGIILNNNTIKYENYKWECNNPTNK